MQAIAVTHTTDYIAVMQKTSMLHGNPREACRLAAVLTVRLQEELTLRG